MKIVYQTLFAALITALAVYTTSCDWTGGGGSSDFNTSQGAGVNVNWSGVYFGQLGGGKAVGATSGGPIVRLVLSQGGNRVEVVDNNGSRYEGSVGAPGVVSRTGGEVLSAGSTLVEAQIQWSGKDEVAGKDIEFVGILHVVAVEDIQGDTREIVDTANTVDIPTITNTVTVIQSGPGGTETNVQNTIIEGSAEAQGTADTRTRTTTYQITEANSQYRLQGTWIENEGRSSEVDALSPGGIASITTTTTN